MKVVTQAGTVELGTTETRPTIGITDFSRRVTDDFGVTTVVKRRFSRRMSVRLAVETAAVDVLQQRLAALRATEATWIADERFAWLTARGFFKDFEVTLAGESLSLCSLTIEGLAEDGGVTETGVDPAPDGRVSSLQLLQPIDMTDAVLVSSTVAESDAPAWSSTATYPKGGRVLRAHRLCESLVASNVGRDPATDAAAWLDVGPANRWAMFDQALGTSTVRAGSIAVVLAPGAANALALLDVIGASVRVQANGYDQIVAVRDGAITFAGLPRAGNVTVTITGSGQVSVGTLLVGRAVGLGITSAAPTAGITDYSRKDVDDFGAVTIVERAWSKRMTARALIRTDAVDVVADRIAEVRARPSLWIGQDGQDAVTVYGFFKDFAIEVDENVSTLSLTIEGLSKAAPVVPGLPSGGGSVAWPDITDPLGTKPTDNADKTSENTSKNTAAVGGKPSTEVLSDIAAAKAQQDYFSTVTIPGVNQAVADAGERITAARQRADQAILDADTVNRRVDTLIAEGGGGSDGVDAVARAEIRRVEEAAISRDEAVARESVAIEARLGARVTASAQDVTTAFLQSDQALASRSTTLEASALSGRGTTLNANPDFSYWPDANGNLAPGWEWWSNVVGNAQRIPDQGRRGAWAYRHDVPAGLDMGWWQTPILIDAGWWVMEADTIAHNGSYSGAGMTINGIFNLDFAREADTNGVVGAYGLGQRRRWSKLVKIDGPVDNWHLMQNWAGFAPMEAKLIDWYYCGIRPATDAEIAARKAIDFTIPAVTARVQATEDTLVDLPNRYAAAMRVSTLESQVNFSTDSGLQRTINARIEDRATAISNGAVGAIAQSVETLRTEYNGRIGQVEQAAGAITGIDGRTEVYWRVTGTTNDGATQISLTKRDGSSPLFYIGANTLIDGNLMVTGTVTTRTIQNGAVTNSITTTGGTFGFQQNTAQETGTATIGIAGTGYVRIDVRLSTNFVDGESGFTAPNRWFLALYREQGGQQTLVGSTAFVEGPYISFWDVDTPPAGVARYFVRITLSFANRAGSVSNTKLNVTEYKK